MTVQIQTGYLFLMILNTKWFPTKLKRGALIRYRLHTSLHYNQLWGSVISLFNTYTPSFLRSHFTSRHTWLWASRRCLNSPVSSLQVPPPVSFVAGKALLHNSQNAPASLQIAHFLLKVSDVWYIKQCSEFNPDSQRPSHCVILCYILVTLHNKCVATKCWPRLLKTFTVLFHLTGLDVTVKVRLGNTHINDSLKISNCADMRGPPTSVL